MTELTRSVATVPRNAEGERIPEKRSIFVAGEEYTVWVIPMSLGDQLEFNQKDLDLNNLKDPDVVFELYDAFLGDQTKDALKEGDFFEWKDLKDLKVGFATEIMEEISLAAGIEMDNETLDDLRQTLQELEEEGNSQTSSEK